VTIAFSEPVKDESANLTIIKNYTKVELLNEEGENRTFLVDDWNIIGLSSNQLLIKVDFSDYSKLSG